MTVLWTLGSLVLVVLAALVLMYGPFTMNAIMWILALMATSAYCLIRACQPTPR